MSRCRPKSRNAPRRRGGAPPPGMPVLHRLHVCRNRPGTQSKAQASTSSSRRRPVNVMPPCASSVPPATDARDALRAGHADEHFVRAGEVELGDVRIEREHDRKMALMTLPPRFDAASMPRYAVGVNDIVPTFRAMTRRIAFLVFPQFQILDATGPIAAFEIAGALPARRLPLRSSRRDAGPVAALRARACMRRRLTAAAGHPDRRRRRGHAPAAVCGKTLAVRVRAARGTHARVASVCSGTYVLAAAGLLDGRRATTHWSVTADFSRRFPKVRLEPDRIYRPGREDVELGGHHRRHRSGAGADRRGPGRGHRPAHGAAARGLSSPAGRPVAVLAAAADGTQPTAASASYGIMSGHICASGSASPSSPGRAA